MTPNEPRGDSIKNLRHHKKLWRCRIGDRRLIYACYPEHSIVQLICIGNRDEVYERLQYEPDSERYKNFSEMVETALNPYKETPDEWAHYVYAEKDGQDKRTIPYLITEDLLNQWRVSKKYHEHFLGCETEDDLQDCGASREGHLLEGVELGAVFFGDQPGQLLCLAGVLGEFDIDIEDL